MAKFFQYPSSVEVDGEKVVPMRRTHETAMQKAHHLYHKGINSGEHRLVELPGSGKLVKVSNYAQRGVAELLRILQEPHVMTAH